MLKIVSEPTFTHPVKAKVPVDGGYRDENFKATFRVVSPETAGEFALDTIEGTRDFLKKVIISLDDLEDTTGRPVPYSDEVRDAVLALPYARKALITSYYGGMTGAALGN